MPLYYSGKEGSFAVEGAPDVFYTIDKWEFDSTTQAVEVSNFQTVLSQQLFLPNLIGGTIRASGPYTDPLGIPGSDVTYIAGRPVGGQYVSFFLGIGGGLGWSVTALVTNCVTTQDVQDAARMEITATVTPNPNLLP